METAVELSEIRRSMIGIQETKKPVEVVKPHAVDNVRLSEHRQSMVREEENTDKAEPHKSGTKVTILHGANKHKVGTVLGSTKTDDGSHKYQVYVKGKSNPATVKHSHIAAHKESSDKEELADVGVPLKKDKDSPEIDSEVDVKVLPASINGDKVGMKDSKVKLVGVRKK